VSGPCLSSSVTGRPLRPATRHSLGWPLPNQLADRPRAHPRAPDCSGFRHVEMPQLVVCGINSPFGELSHTLGQVAHVLLTLAPLKPPRIATRRFPFDLHVLSTPPAFVLSQNQTLRESLSQFALNKFGDVYNPLATQRFHWSNLRSDRCRTVARLTYLPVRLLIIARISMRRFAYTKSTLSAAAYIHQPVFGFTTR
jgi:hypothetical protein